MNQPDDFEPYGVKEDPADASDELEQAIEAMWLTAALLFVVALGVFTVWLTR